jgi:hypothetical protein
MTFSMRSLAPRASQSTSACQWQVSLSGGAFTDLTNTAPYSGVTTTLTNTNATVALYHLDEGTEQVLNDASGKNRNGVLGASPAVETVDPQWSTDAPAISLCTQGAIPPNRT